MRDEQLLAYLKGSCSGRKNRVGGTELERTLHVSGTDLRKLVNQLRRKTHPIASDRSGYFYATTAGEVYDTIRQLKRMAAGLEAADYTVSSSNEIQTVVESMIGKVDVIYAPTDNMIAAGMATVAMIANENKIPIICGEEGMVKEGGLATYGINYYELGYKTGEMAAKILTEGADPASMPIEYLSTEECSLLINKETADTLGIDVSSYDADSLYTAE